MSISPRRNYTAIATRSIFTLLKNVVMCCASCLRCSRFSWDCH